MVQTPTVYVPNRSAHVFEAAKRYGALRFVTEGRVNRFDTSEMWRAWDEALQDSSPDDYIIITSLNILCSIGSALFGSRHGKLNLLLYRNGVYIHREIWLDDRGPN